MRSTPEIKLAHALRIGVITTRGKRLSVTQAPNLSAPQPKFSARADCDLVCGNFIARGPRPARRDLHAQETMLTPLADAQAPEAGGPQKPTVAPTVPWLAPVVEIDDGVMDGLVEGVDVREGLVGEVMGLKIAPDRLDFIEFGGVFRQPLRR
jgi:hypothetical protein